MVPPVTIPSSRWDAESLLSHLGRLEAVFEETEATLHAFLPEAGRFDRLRREIRELGARYPDPEARPRLYGVLVGIKDVFHVAGFPTRAGGRLPEYELQGPEAASVTALREAGALVLGKTISTEFAYLAPGPTRNPHHREHTPGGSSSGSAAAVGAGLCPLALGTQTIGSVCRPAAYCGVVGFKPSYDRIPRDGVIPLSPSLDHVGLFTPDVSGAIAAAAVLCDRWRPATPTRRPILAIPEGPYLSHASKEGRDHFRATCERLAAAGYVVRPVDAMPDFNAIAGRHRDLLAAEAAAVHADWFGRYRELYHPETAGLICRGREISPARIDEARAGRETVRTELTRLLDHSAGDLWISPAACGPAPRGLESTGDPIINLPWTYAGLPVVSVPSGRSAAGLPFGLQLTGRWYEDERLLAWAAEIERSLVAPADSEGAQK